MCKESLVQVVHTTNQGPVPGNIGENILLKNHCHVWHIQTAHTDMASQTKTIGEGYMFNERQQKKTRKTISRSHLECAKHEAISSTNCCPTKPSSVGTPAVYMGTGLLKKHSPRYTEGSEQSRPRKFLGIKP